MLTPLLLFGQYRGIGLNEMEINTMALEAVKLRKMLPTYNRKFLPGPQKRKRMAAVRVLVHPPQVNRTLCGA